MAVAIQPAGSPASRKHYLDTIENPVKISLYEELIGTDLVNLQKASKNGQVALWGVTPGTNNANVSKYKKLSIGDSVIFTRDKTAFACAQITYLFRNKQLAENLWGKDNKKQTWEFMYALNNVENLEISYELLQAAIGSKSGDNFMGFRVLDDEKSEGASRLLDKKMERAQSKRTNYWWVNQGKTYSYEVGQDFMWSPITQSDGKSSNSYNNMSKLSPGDLVFSHSKNSIRAIGIVQGKSFKSPQPNFGRSGSPDWSDVGWYCDVAFSELNPTIEYKLHLDKIKPLLPVKYSPLDKNGDAVLSYLFSINQELGDFLLELSRVEPVAIEALQVQAEVMKIEMLDEMEEVSIIQKENIGPLEKENLVKSRRGQGIFKSNLKLYEKSCRVTGLTDKSHLTASHIKPWRDSNNKEKIDGYNGLLLSPHIDRLFNYGFISFTDDGKLLISSKLNKNVLTDWNIKTDLNVGKFASEQCKYLDYHRNNIFKV